MCEVNRAKEFQFLNDVRYNRLSRIQENLSLNQVDINFKDQFGKNALHIALENGHKDLCEFLVAKGINVNALDNYNRGIFHYAIRTGSISILEYVESLIKVKEDYKDEDGSNPFHIFAKYGKIIDNAKKIRIFLKYLHKKGYDINAKDNLSYNPIAYLCSVSKLYVMSMCYLKEGADTRSLFPSSFSRVNHSPHGSALLHYIALRTLEYSDVNYSEKKKSNNKKNNNIDTINNNEKNKETTNNKENEENEGEDYSEESGEENDHDIDGNICREKQIKKWKELMIVEGIYHSPPSFMIYEMEDFDPDDYKKENFLQFLLRKPHQFRLYGGLALP